MTLCEGDIRDIISILLIFDEEKAFDEIPASAIKRFSLKVARAINDAQRKSTQELNKLSTMNPNTPWSDWKDCDWVKTCPECGNKVEVSRPNPDDGLHFRLRCIRCEWRTES